ncbi:MAG: aminomethyl-transferring glycine dehydrogenase subunit GcvPB, partial [Desulfobacteraceae bacterium]
MRHSLGATGLIFSEPLLWEMGAKGRMGYSMPPRDVPSAAVEDQLTGPGPDLPDLCEPDIVRHYTRLSQWNIGVDSAMYPLGSCTMKYNPKTNERQACLPGIAAAHPLLPADHCQGLLGMIYKL